MPGHLKKSEGPDPDPSNWLYVTPELRKKLNSKPYDAKKSCWVPEKGTGGYLEGLIEAMDGDKVTVKILESKESKVFKKDQVGQVNPPKFDCCDDMAGLTYLNDACVLWNSVVRYKNELIYTYSGLFCIAINPYKRFPIYTQRAMEIYIGKRKNECPPHIFGVAEGSYQGMTNTQKNQSILITGESGAGKTENTKKVIAYFASIGASGKKAEGEASLEDKIVQTNPVLEAWGNAKTVRNDNSSRFGKFIRVWFNQAGKLSGGDMVTYLLEKSRLTFQAENERCYHSFYNIMSNQVPDLKKKALLSDNIHDYWWVSQGKVTVESIDDKEDMMFANEAFDILGFTNEEKYNIYKLTAVVMHMGNLTKDFMPVGKEEQAEVRDETNARKVAEICGIDPEWMMTYFCKPKLKVGTEWVTKGQTCPQAANSVAGIGRKIYELVFNFIVEKCNTTLVDPTMKKIQYIGCLDIAGFEIFDFNGFEQICINFCNEKLQQFFNQHMFILEQEEYIREGIDWANVDFGMDLQKCIDMFEKPMGLLAILEEESLFPKATDLTFKNKLFENLQAKCPNFQKPNPKPDPNAHFAVVHYAAVVSYNVTGWLEKNKDPLNDTIVELMKNGSNALLVKVFEYHPGQPTETPKDSGGSKKKGGGKTVSSFYKVQLDDLMKVLYATDPSFIRCVVPNTHKQPGGVEPGLIMHQYQCNGVLAGIAICRKGFPNKVTYQDFKQRYNIIAAGGVAKAKNDKQAAKVVLDAVKLESEKYRLGHTKVFFRAGILGYMEEMREDRLAEVLAWLQSQARGKASRMVFKKMQEQKLALYACQRAIRNYYIGKNWLWWQLWLALKPDLKCNQFAKYKAEYEEKIALAERNMDKAVEECNRTRGEHEKLSGEKTQLLDALQSGGSAVQDVQDKANRMESNRNDLQKQLDAVLSRLAEEEEGVTAISGQTQKVEREGEKLRDDIKVLESQLESCEEDKVSKETQIKNLKDEISHQEDMLARLQKEKRATGDNRLKTEEDVQVMEDKCNHLNKIKAKLEQHLDETEDSLEREKKFKAEAEKMKRKTESDLQLTQETLSDIEKINGELTQTLQRKEKEMASIMAKIDDERTLSGKYGKQVKELQARVEELDDSLALERQNRAKAEKMRTVMSRDIEELAAKLEEAGNTTSTQIELNKKREADLGRLKVEMDEAAVAHENSLASLRQKHNNVITDLGEQIDQMNRNKAKVEKDKASAERKLQEAREQLNEAMRERSMLERNAKMMQASIVEANTKLDELARALNEADSSHKKVDAENQDLVRQIDENENNLASLSKLRTSLMTQLEDTKRLADAESRDKSALMSKFKNLTSELESLRERIEQESEMKAELVKAMSKAQAESQLWKSKYETEGIARIEDLERSRSKLLARVNEGEETIESLNSKIASTDRVVHRLNVELEELQEEYERIHGAAVVAEKKAKNFDKVVAEWQAKTDDLAAEIEASQAEARSYNSEVFRLQAAWNEAVEQLDMVKRENKNLGDEIKDLVDQLGDGGRSIHELEKQRRRLEVEKEELQAALEEAEAALEQEENKVMRAQLDLGMAKQETERQLKEKEEEFDNSRKNHQRAMDSMQASLEAEVRAKAEALRMKKKLESDINELEIALDHINKTNAEANKSIKRLQQHLREVETAYEDEARMRREVAEKAALADRKANAFQGELDENQALIASTERAKNQADMELGEARSSVAEMTDINSRVVMDKRHLESALHAIQVDIDETLVQIRNHEEKTKKAMIDAARLADELRSEQEHVAGQERARRALETQSAELEQRLVEVNDNAARVGRNALAKLETKIKELELELANAQSRSGEASKAYQRSERRIKELQFQLDEEQKNQQQMSDLATKLQQKIRTYKKQIEDAEEIAALNLAKFRKAQQELEEAEERSRLAEGNLNSPAKYFS